MLNLGRSGVNGVSDRERENVSSRFHNGLKEVISLPVLPHQGLLSHMFRLIDSIFCEFWDHVIPNLHRKDFLPTTLSSTAVAQHFLAKNFLVLVGGSWDILKKANCLSLFDEKDTLPETKIASHLT